MAALNAASSAAFFSSTVSAFGFSFGFWAAIAATFGGGGGQAGLDGHGQARRIEAFVEPEDWDRYPTQAARRAEVLARMCRRGADDFGRLDALLVERCDLPPIQSDAVRWLHEEIYDLAGQPVRPARL